MQNDYKFTTNECKEEVLLFVHKNQQLTNCGKPCYILFGFQFFALIFASGLGLWVFLFFPFLEIFKFMEKRLWAAILSDLKNELSPVVFKTWFSQCQLKEIVSVNQKTNRAIVVCTNNFAREQLEKRYQNLITTILNQKTNKDNQVVFKVGITAKKTNHFVVGGLFSESNNQPIGPQSPFFKNYTFANFIVGTSNKLAVAAAEAVAANPGFSYNPLFFFGQSGVGKTHLLQAIANQLFTTNQELNIVYLTCEQFTNEFIDALTSRQTKRFRQRLRTVDVFLVDDIQFLATKENTQEEFFHTFNELYLGSKQIILASDKHPAKIGGLEGRLVSRFLGGLMVEINPPDLEMKIKLIQEKSAKLGLVFPAHLAPHLARKINGNIRELEGVLFQLNSSARLTNQPLNLTFIKNVCSQARKERFQASPKKILAIIQKNYQLPTASFLGSSRKKNCLLPRQIAMYLLRDIGGLSLSAIGRLFDNRDHSTVIHSIEKINALAERDSQMEKELNFLRLKIQN